MDPMTAASNGAAWLSKHVPGWWERVDFGTLTMDDGDKCILGQVFAKDAAEYSSIVCGYTFAAMIIWEELMTAEWLLEHGFIALSGSDYTALKEAWWEEMQAIRRLIPA